MPPFVLATLLIKAAGTDQISNALTQWIHRATIGTGDKQSCEIMKQSPAVFWQM
jgi:hypothetical protein